MGFGEDRLRKIPEPADPDDKLFDHIDELLLSIGDDASGVVTKFQEAANTFRIQAIVTPVLAVLLTIFLIPYLFSAAVSYLLIAIYVIFLMATGWFTVRTLMLYASYSARCTRMIDAAKKFREAKTANAA